MACLEIVSATLSCGHYIRRDFQRWKQADVPRKEFLNAVDWMISNAGKKVGEISFGIERAVYKTQTA